MHLKADYYPLVPLAQEMNEYIPWIHTILCSSKRSFRLSLAPHFIRRENQEMETTEPGTQAGTYNPNAQKLREEDCWNFKARLGYE